MKNVEKQASESLQSKSFITRLIPILLYAIPVIFFVVCYFLISVSGEDIYQGANTTPNIIGDSIAAFKYNARLSDMYAWSVINFFDYQYSFGVDTIFRIIDVLMGVGIIYGMTYLVLGRKPKLRMADSLYYLLCFTMIFITPHGRTLYAGFSVIHNYLIITASTLCFSLPFLRLAHRSTMMKTSFISCLLMLVAGFVFGFSSNITPIAFLITFAIIKIVKTRKQNKFQITGWEICGLIGILLAMAISYLLGPGVNSYANGSYAQTYDYVTISQIMASPISSTVRIAKHAVVNFGRVLLPPIIILGAAFVAIALLNTKRPRLSSLMPRDSRMRSTFFICTLFTFIHVIISSQIAFPIRIALPAYIAITIATAITIKSLIAHANATPKAILSALVIIASVAILVVRTTIAISYRHKAGIFFDKVRNASGNSLCVYRNEVHSPSMRYIYLAQEDILAEWAMPEQVYNKTITFCD